MEQRINIQFCVLQLQNVYRNISNATYGDKASYKTSEKKKKKKMRLQKSKEKTILIIFYDSDGIIYKEFVPQDKIVNEDITWALWSVCWQELIGFLNTECKATDRFSMTILFTGAPPYVNFSFPNRFLVLNHSPFGSLVPYSFGEEPPPLDLASLIWLFFVPETKNEAKGKAV